MRRIKRVGLLALTGLALLAMSGCERWSSNLVSVAGGGPGNAPSDYPSFSPDGTKIAFVTRSSNLGPTDTTLCTMNYEPVVTRPCDDIYIRDLATGTTTLLTQNAAGTNSANFDSTAPVFSPDGTKVAFQSQASDLVDPGGTGQHSYQIFVKDLGTGTASHVAAGSTGGLVFSPDSTKVAFSTASSNLGPTDTNGTNDVYVKDLATGAYTLVSVNQAGTDSSNGYSAGPHFTPDGTKVVFASGGSNFGFADTNYEGDLYVRDLVTRQTSLVTANAAGTSTGNGGTYGVTATSPDGAKVAFYTTATDLGPADPNFAAIDLYVRDVSTGQTWRLPARVPPTGQGAPASALAVFSPDSRKLAYVTWAGAAGDLEADGGPASVYLLDLDTGQIRDISGPSAGGNGPSWDPSFSPDSTRVVFQSLADDLVTGDSNGERDIFVTDLTKTQGAISLVSLAHDGSAANGESRWPSFSPDPDRPLIAFASEASNIDPLDSNAQRDVFVAEWKDPDA